MGVKIRTCLPAVLGLALLGAGPAWAQTGSITGRVTDAETGAPLAGAQVEAVAGGQVAASGLSDENGQYRLTDLQAGTYSIVVTLVGYGTRQVDGVRVVAGGTSMQAVALTAAAFELNPIIVSASKRQEKVLDAPASVAVVDSRTVEERPVTTPVDHLRSVPGVDIATHGVQSTTVVARGFNNIFSGSLHALTDNRIAGVPSLRVNVLHFIPSTNEDVERMEVVLGPGAALYGPNTADGVLHIITKSPLDEQGTSVSIAGGTQSVLNGSFRTAQLLGDDFGIKLSGQFFQAEEWPYVDPVEQAEREKFDNDTGFFRQDLMNATGIDLAEANRRIALIGNRDYDVQRFGADLRADWRVNDDLTTILAAGFTNVGSGIELTGLGAAQAKDWTYSYVQARATWGRFFAQAYANMSDAGETYLLRNGAPITDRSKLYVAQLQHGLSLGDRQDLTYGLDFLYTNPVTERSINGGYEDDDETTEFGAYLQSETSLTDQLELVLAGRLDTHSALPEAIFSPRAALVFQPTETHAFRLTYNRAFSTPSSLNQFLDLGSAIPNEDLARLGYSLRVQGTGADGFSFVGPDGLYRMRSPFNVLAGGSNAELLTVNAATAFNRAIQALAYQAALAGTPLDPNLVAFLSGLTPTDDQIPLAYLDVNNVAAGPQPLSELQLTDLDPIRESTSTTIEAGYKGVLGDRLLLAADLWYSRMEDMVTPLTIQTPLILLDGASTAAYLVPQLTQFFMAAGMSEAEAQAQAAAVAGQITPTLASIPVGVISSDDIHANGAQLLTTYINVDDAFDVYGLDLAATMLIADEWSLSGTLSLVNENLFETDRGEEVTLNAPKTKGTISVAYRGASNGLNAELRARYNDSFPVRSGVYNGTQCLGESAESGAEPCVDSSTLLDVVLGYDLPFQGASLQLSVQNLLDEDYRSFPGTPTIGRMALLQLKYEF
ncbi:MAG TPA: TonB-dependent receptor [Longimicrobiales bacterium]